LCWYRGGEKTKTLELTRGALAFLGMEHKNRRGGKKKKGATERRVVKWKGGGGTWGSKKEGS